FYKFAVHILNDKLSHKGWSFQASAFFLLHDFNYSKPFSAHIITFVMERPAYRIIDANFNRAREACRVVEEFCRFVLNSGPLTERAKKLRHELSASIGKLDAGRLMAGRDSLGDVGAGMTIEKQLTRGDLNDCFTAGCKRLTEALRALAEVIRIDNEPVAEVIERLRFDTYALEKDIVLFSDASAKFKSVKLYIVITSSLPTEVISLAYKCTAGGADCIQLRAKDIDDDVLFALAVEFVKICRDAGVVSIINDRADIAVVAGADGVHLGQNDLPVEQARRLQLAPLIIGKSTHSLRQLRAACNEGLTYVGLGPVFATPTKPGADAVGLEYVTGATQELADTGVAHVAIGGITPNNVEQVLNAGAESIAVCSAVTRVSDPAAACRIFKEKIKAFRKD
ncbi:MAG: thiamine phosphate synthase, partial [Sedimentisphaerales bacterium]|nr:thiamine phosphate synthase [Sedimentisphaerales bacterium]